MPIETASQLLVETIATLSKRAPAIIATAAHHLNKIILSLHFGDSTHAEVRAHHSRIIALEQKAKTPSVEVYFDDRALKLLFDMEQQPIDQVLMESLDVRGSRDDVLATWRTFQVLSQRASGLRAVQELWKSYRDQKPEFWGAPLTPRTPYESKTVFPSPRSTGWKALDYLDARYPRDADLESNGTMSTAPRMLWDGRQSDPWWQLPSLQDADLLEYMQLCKNRVGKEMESMVPNREPKSYLYDLIKEYPSREGKGLRPTLIIATCCAFGGRAIDAMRCAAAIEMFHNGFLVHDDIADGSFYRRGKATLHEEVGLGLAVNTGDAMNLLAIDGVLSNLPTLGLASTLALIHEIVHMCRETLEGQAIELGWIHEMIIPEGDENYFEMSTKKTGWYTCITPCRVGAICAGETNPEFLDTFNETFRLIGIAFQIQDDVLNLIGEEALYGKEPLGDLLEGKRTIMLLHLFRTAPDEIRKRIHDIIKLPRSEKTFQNAEEILEAMKQFGSIEYAIALADRLAHEGVRRFEEDLQFLPENEAKAVLRQIANYVTTRPL